MNWSEKVLTNFAKRTLGFVKAFVPTPAEKFLVKENKKFWETYESTLKCGKNIRCHYVLIEAYQNPIINICNGSFGAIVCHARNLHPLYILRGGDRSLKRVLKSYHPGGRFVTMRSFRYFPARLCAAWSAYGVWRRLQVPADILDFEVDGIRFGDIIYDNILLKELATIRKIDRNVLSVIYTFFIHRYIINDIIRRYRPESFVVSHTVGMQGGVFSRYLVQHNIEVMNRIGSQEILVQKLRTRDDIGFYPAKPERSYFDYMMKLPDGVVLPLADAYLDERHNQRIGHIAVEMAFNRNKRFFDNREEFCRVYGLDPSKKTAFVMLHAFNDHPHSHFSKRLIFQDYFDWFERTLRLAQTIDSVNWVFKEHPAACFYPTRDVDLHQMFREVPQSNIAFLGAEADFNALSVRYQADVIVTCLGTAGMEYAGVGIPCVLGGESPYSGFGFAIEADSISEYEATLRSLDRLAPLSEAQRKAAKIVTYFELSMLNSARYLFCPKYDYRQIVAMTPQTLYRDVAELMQGADKAALRRQVDILAVFVNDQDRTQYIDFDRHPYMRGALDNARLASGINERVEVAVKEGSLVKAKE